MFYDLSVSKLQDQKMYKDTTRRHEEKKGLGIYLILSCAEEVEVMVVVVVLVWKKFHLPAYSCP